MESHASDNSERTQQKHQQHDVVIVGAGFAGVSAAQALGRAGVDVLLLDQNNYHQFQPLLYQVATAQVAVSTVARPLRAIFHRYRDHVTVRTARVNDIDTANRSVTTTDGLCYQGKVLVIAAGAEANFFDTPGAREHAYPLYSVDDATALSSALLGALDRASATNDAAPHDDTFSVVVVGSGPTGVETAGAIAENINFVVAKYFSPEFAANSCSVHLVDMVDTVLGPFSEKSQQYTRRKLEEMGVNLHLGSAAASVSPDGITLADDTRIDANVVIWAGGLKGTSLVGASGLPTGRGGRIDVSSDLTVPGVPGVYVLGDAANIVDAKDRKLPQLGSVAQQCGKWAAENIQADLHDLPRRPFEYTDKGIMAMIGRGHAVAEIGTGRRRILGPFAFLAWLAVHVVLLSGIPQRISAIFAWCRDYLTHSRPQVVVHQPDVYRFERVGDAAASPDPD